MIYRFRHSSTRYEIKLLLPLHLPLGLRPSLCEHPPQCPETTTLWLHLTFTVLPCPSATTINYSARSRCICLNWRLTIIFGSCRTVCVKQLFVRDDIKLWQWRNHAKGPQRLYTIFYSPTACQSRTAQYEARLTRHLPSPLCNFSLSHCVVDLAQLV